MASERSQVLHLLADRRIDIAEAERLLAVLGGRERFFTLASWTLAIFLASALSQSHIGADVYAWCHSTLQSLAGSEAFHNLKIFAIRVLGEFP